jgi:hypothetical protein
MEHADSPVTGARDPESHVRPRRNLPREEPEGADIGDETTPFDPAVALPGAVLMVPNPHWGFEGVTSADHPGACTYYRQPSRDAVLVKGTDAENVRYPRRYFFIDPTAENGLQKRTAFELVPRLFRLHRLRLYFPQRHLGRLDETTLRDLRAELARIHPEE